MHFSDDKKVSVIIATYMRDQYLLETMDSILKQTYKNLQIIVVSDGHLKTTKECMERVNDGRVEYYSIPHSGRPAVPRNYGISKSSGEYIAFCDDDDIWEPEKIQKQVECFNSNPSVALIYTDYVSFSDQEKISQSQNLHTSFEQQLYHNKVPFSSAMVRRDIIENVGYFDERKILKASEDFLFFTKIIACYPFYYLECPLMKYRIHFSGISRVENSLKKIKYFIRVSICISELCQSNNVSFKKQISMLYYHMKQVLKQILFPWYQRVQISKGKKCLGKEF